jgi:hypothetical protein
MDNYDEYHKRLMRVFRVEGIMIGIAIGTCAGVLLLGPLFNASVSASISLAGLVMALIFCGTQIWKLIAIRRLNK